LSRWNGATFRRGGIPVSRAQLIVPQKGEIAMAQVSACAIAIDGSENASKSEN
jgi:hypothetical protein